MEVNGTHRTPRRPLEPILWALLDVSGFYRNSKWRRDRDSNPGDAFTSNGFQDRRLQPLGHPSCDDVRVPGLLRLDDLQAIHIGTEGVWNADGAVCLLVVLQDGDQGSADREA